MASMDDLLAQFQAEFEQKRSDSSPSESHTQSTDDLLAEVQAQFEKPVAKSHNAMNREDSHLDDLLNAAKSELSASPSNKDDTDKALEAFKAQSRPQNPDSNQNATDEALQAFKQQSPAVQNDTDKALAAFKQQSRPQPSMPNQDATDEALNAFKQQSSTDKDATDEALAAFKNQSRPQPPQNPQTEDALVAFKSKFQQKQAQSTSQSKAPTDNELENLKSQFAQKVKANTPKPPQASQATDRVLAQLKQEYKQQKQDVDAQLQNTEDIVRQERLAEQRRQQRRKALQRKAEAWLKDLDIQSDEGLWFEEFAYSYDSRLAAAIDYLQALEETR